MEQTVHDNKTKVWVAFNVQIKYHDPKPGSYLVSKKYVKILGVALEVPWKSVRWKSVYLKLDLTYFLDFGKYIVTQNFTSATQASKQQTFHM